LCAPSTFVLFQELRVQLAVFTRTAAYSTPMPSFIYDELAAILHPIALRLRDTTIKAIVSLWQRVNLVADDPRRLGLPSRCDQNWFSTRFCGGVKLSTTMPLPELGDAYSEK
jgi:hypothetical protein